MTNDEKKIEIQLSAELQCSQLEKKIRSRTRIAVAIIITIIEEGRKTQQNSFSSIQSQIEERQPGVLFGFAHTRISVCVCVYIEISFLRNLFFHCRRM